MDVGDIWNNRNRSMGIVSLFVKKYRNVYIKYDKFPYHKLTGYGTLVYTGKIVTDVKGIPEGYDPKIDYYFSCECDYPKWRKIEKKP